MTDSQTGRRVQNVLIEVISESDSTQRCSTYSDYTGRYVTDFVISLVPGAEYEKIPVNFRLWQNYPNPFNPITRINYQLPHPCDVRLVIYDILGRKVKTLIDADLPAGYHTVDWTGDDDYGKRTASGVYFYRLISGDNKAFRKMLLVK